MRLPLALLILIVACPAYAAVWGDDPSHASPGDKPSMAICQKTKAMVLPKAGARSADCDAGALYYGIGRVANPVAARLCALADPAATGPSSGPALLATIYANGRGAPRDLDLAIAYACRIDGAPAEMDARIAHLTRLKAGAANPIPFDVCDDVTSGAMTSACTRRDAERSASLREAALAAIGNGLDAGKQAAFIKLLGAERIYAKSVGERETDSEGTMGPARVIAAEEAQNEIFMTTLRALLAGRLPAATSSLPDADRSLADAYDKLIGLKDTADLGSVEKSGIEATQRAWVVYRDAFAAFARIAAPDGAAQAARTELTVQRAKDLSALLG